MTDTVAPRRRATRRRAESRARYYIREQAELRGWRTRHPDLGGDTLEEQEIIGAFPDIGLGIDRPDFLLLVRGDPTVVVEAKNEAGKAQEALDGAIEYADAINAGGPAVRGHLALEADAAGRR